MKWRNFSYKDEVYDLSHLHPFEYRLEHYKINVAFSMHCFTRTPLPGESFDGLLSYTSPKETNRIFCPIRYELSKQLPEIISNLNEKTCWHTHHGNFFTIEIQDVDGKKKDYEVYFDVFKAGKGYLTLQIQSSYVREESHKATQPKKRKVRFSVIVKKRFERKKLHPPR